MSCLHDYHYRITPVSDRLPRSSCARACRTASLDSDKQDLYVCEECYYKLYDGDPTIEGQLQKLQKETRHLDPIIRGVTALYLYPFACTHPKVKNRIVSILQVALNDPDTDVRATAALSLELIEQKPEFDRPSTKANQEAIKWRKIADYSLKDVYKMQFPVDSRITNIFPRTPKSSKEDSSLKDIEILDVKKILTKAERILEEAGVKGANITQVPTPLLEEMIIKIYYYYYLLNLRGITIEMKLNL